MGRRTNWLIHKIIWTKIRKAYLPQRSCKKTHQKMILPNLYFIQNYKFWEDLRNIIFCPYFLDDVLHSREHLIICGSFIQSISRITYDFIWLFGLIDGFFQLHKSSLFLSDYIHSIFQLSIKLVNTHLNII
jgi:hypothetical protein